MQRKFAGRQIRSEISTVSVVVAEKARGKKKAIDPRTYRKNVRDRPNVIVSCSTPDEHCYGGPFEPFDSPVAHNDVIRSGAQTALPLNRLMVLDGFPGPITPERHKWVV